MPSTHIRLVSTSMAARDARVIVYVGLAFVVHFLIWASVPPAFALALSAALILIERLAGELADSIIGPVAVSDSTMAEHFASIRSPSSGTNCNRSCSELRHRLGWQRSQQSQVFF